MKRGIPIFCAGAVSLAAIGCTTYYYRVTDPTTGKTYYTKDMYQDKGAVHLEDGKTGNAVTLQNSDIREISKEEFEAGRARP